MIARVKRPDSRGFGGSGKSMLRVFISDDHPVFRRVLVAFLESEGDFEIAGEAGDGDTTLDRLNETEVDVVTLDVNMPGPPIGNLIQGVRRLRPDAAILVVTMLEHERYRDEAIRAGADGFVLKKNASTQLADAIRKACGEKSGPA